MLCSCSTARGLRAPQWELLLFQGPPQSPPSLPLLLAAPGGDGLCGDTQQDTEHQKPSSAVAKCGAELSARGDPTGAKPTCPGLSWSPAPLGWSQPGWGCMAQPGPELLQNLSVSSVTPAPSHPPSPQHTLQVGDICPAIPPAAEPQGLKQPQQYLGTLLPCSWHRLRYCCAVGSWPGSSLHPTAPGWSPWPLLMSPHPAAGLARGAHVVRDPKATQYLHPGVLHYLPLVRAPRQQLQRPPLAPRALAGSVVPLCQLCSHSQRLPALCRHHAAHSIATVPSGNFILCCGWGFFLLFFPNQLRRRL
ncbi:uncharacterized protein LOC120509676 [Passer montanus]|uniref:uncharacterized protein LOC120509676 n=1 Tax=Passer montanus TaxID=9160 RepID=UPI0019616B72|nr:uncharacterized protein LOC120509676 [Passer montanus]